MNKSNLKVNFTQGEIQEITIRNPYKRCPIYGAALVSTEFYDADFCMHSPRGCISPAQEAFALQGREYDYHQTGMTQNDIIFGGVDRLISNAINKFYPYEKIGPHFMITSCASEIIGDDIDYVVSIINKGLPNVKVTCGGFQGDQYFGLNNALRELVIKFADPSPVRQSNLVNIIGNIGLSRQWRVDVYEIKRILTELGLEVNQIGCDSTIDNLKISSRAIATILLSTDVGLPAASYLHKNFGIPYLSSYMFLPLGIHGIEVWLRQVGTAVGISNNEINNYIKKSEREVRVALTMGLHQMTYIEKVNMLRGLPVAIVAESGVAFSWARFVTEELGMIPVLLGLRTSIDNTIMDELTDWQRGKGLSIKVLIKPDFDNIKKALKETKPEFVFGSSVEAELGQELGIRYFLHIANPNSQYVNITPTPFLGYKGLLYLTEAILNTLED